MAKEIIWSKRALKDRFQILEYWISRNQSSTFSKKLDLIFLQKIKLLSLYPHIGKKTNLDNIRIKVVNSYLIFNEISETHIYIFCL